MEVKLNFNYIIKVFQIKKWFDKNYPFKSNERLEYIPIIRDEENDDVTLEIQDIEKRKGDIRFDYFTFEDKYFAKKNPIECLESPDRLYSTTVRFIRKNVLKKIYKTDIPEEAYHCYLYNYIGHKYMLPNENEDYLCSYDLMAVSEFLFINHPEFYNNLLKRYSLQRCGEIIYANRKYETYRSTDVKNAVTLALLEAKS